MVVDLTIAFHCELMLVSEGVESPGTEVGSILDLILVPTDVVPGSHDTNAHVVQTPLGNGTIEDGDG